MMLFWIGVGLVFLAGISFLFGTVVGRRIEQDIQAGCFEPKKTKNKQRIT